MTRPKKTLEQAAADEREALLHELHVHQVELEMQNEELRSARQETEAALRRYTELFDFAPVGYVVLDDAGVIVQANLEFARMVGVPSSQLVGWLLANFVAPAERSRVRRYLYDLGQGGPPGKGATLEVTLRPEDGEPITVRLVASAHADARAGNLVAVHDVTDAKRAEMAREEITRKDEFLAALSHELRNPLFPIRTSLSVLRHAEPGDPQARSAMATIERQTSHLVHIVDDLLEATRIAHAKVELRRERLELSRLVVQAVEDHRAEFEERRVALEMHLGGPAWIDADVTRIGQIIGNLLMNASKFTPAGGHVDVGLRREGSQAIVSVRDTGPGIAEDMRERLFVPFSQAPQTLDRSRGGLGLGLALVKGLVELHGGTVAVQSEGPGRGSEFTVRLPIVEAPTAATAEDGPGAPHPIGQRRRVLVIEDNSDAADSMRELLEYEGHDARVAYDGATGVALAHDFHPDVVFCDIGLPGMNGYEVARALRADPEAADAYLVALSGYARPEDRERSAEAGFDQHLAKPPSEEDMDRALAH